MAAGAKAIKERKKRVPAKAIPTEERLLLDSERVAALLSMSVRTLWRMVLAGRFPQPKRFTRKLVRWHTSDVLGWVKEQ